MSMLPAIVLVHGAWHTPKHYEGFIRALRAASFETYCPQLPTCNADEHPPPLTLDSDVHAVRAVVEGLLDADRRVIVIGHSYGGTVTSNAMRGLSLRERKAAGRTGGVVHVIYMAAFMLPTDPYRIIPSPPSRDVFYNQQDEATAEKAASMLVNANPKAYSAKISWAPWWMCEVTYIRCGRDHAVVPEEQEMFIQWANDDGGQIVEENLPEADHSPFLNMTEQLVQIVQRTGKRV